MAAYLDCRLFESGFAIVRCPLCKAEFYQRELLGDLATLAYETVREMMAGAIEEPDARPGMVAVIQTFGS